MGLLSAFTKPLNWQNVSDELKKLSESEELEKIVDQRMEIILREEHPEDYDEFIKNNEEQINGIKKRMIKKYSFEQHPY